MLQRHLDGLRKADRWLLAPLLRKVLRHPIELHSRFNPSLGWWIFLLLRAIDAPALGILRKEDALVLANGLLKARCGDVKMGVARELKALLGAMGRAHGFDEPTRAVLRVVAFFTSSHFRLIDPQPFIPDRELLRLLLPGHCHVPPACSPKFEPLPAELPASSECGVLL